MIVKRNQNVQSMPIHHLMVSLNEGQVTISHQINYISHYINILKQIEIYSISELYEITIDKNYIV
jgi:hypothetical protein